MDRLDNVPDYKIAEMNYLLEHKASRLGVRSSDPGALNGVDAEKLSASAKALGMAMKPMRIATQSNKVSWTVAAAAGLEWAKKVFPNAASDEEAVDLLWDQIFKTCRVYEEDPVKAWEEHAAILKSKADTLNKEQFSALHYTAPGTDLTLACRRTTSGNLPEPSMPKVKASCQTCRQKRSSQLLTSVVQKAMSPLQNRLATMETSSKASKVTFENGEIVEYHS